MPKLGQSMSAKLKDYVNRFPNFKTDGKVLFCKVCSKAVSAGKIFAVKQHMESAKHLQLASSSKTKML